LAAWKWPGFLEKKGGREGLFVCLGEVWGKLDYSCEGKGGYKQHFMERRGGATVNGGRGRVIFCLLGSKGGGGGTEIPGSPVKTVTLGELRKKGS